MAWTDMTQLTNCYAWYKSESLSSAYANGDRISSWSDSSGNGRDITQSTSVNQPLAVASAVNGYMVADFDGSNDRLSSASYTQSGDVVVAMVVSFDVTKSYNGIISIEADSAPSWNNGTSTWISLFTRSQGYFSNYIYRASSGYSMFKTDDEIYTHSTNQYCIITAGLNSKTGVFHENGEGIPYCLESKTSASKYISPSSGTAYIHLGDIDLGKLDGKIAEVVVFDAVNRACEEAAWVEGYLADKYAITLPNGHLFKNEPPANAPTTYNPSSSGGSSSSSTPTAGTQVYPFRQWVEDDFGGGSGGGGAVLHPLRSN